MNKKHNLKDLPYEVRIEKMRKAEKRFILISTTVFVIVETLIFIFGMYCGTLVCSATTPGELTEDTTIIVEQSDAPVLEVATEPTTLEIKTNGRTLDAELQNTMIEMCEKYDVPFALALAVAEQESRFNPEAVSSTCDYGMMQINKINFKWLREKGIEPLDYKGNIEAGVLMLSQAVKKYGDYNLALMAYNGGDSYANRLVKKGTYSTEYSRSTMERFNKWDKYLRGI